MAFRKCGRHAAANTDLGIVLKVVGPDGVDDHTLPQLNEFIVDWRKFSDIDSGGRLSNGNT